MPHTRSVTACVFVGVGSRYEDDDRAGLSHFIEHLVFKGTSRRPDPKDISGTVEAVGGDINAGTEHELTTYWSKVPEPHAEETIDLLVDMLRHSLHRPEDVEKERMVIYEEQRMVEDDPGHRADVLTDALLWPDHPLGREIAGTRDSVARTTRDDVLAHVERYYTPSNIVVSAAGKSDPRRRRQPDRRAVRRLEAGRLDRVGAVRRRADGAAARSRIQQYRAGPHLHSRAGPVDDRAGTALARPA